MAAAELGGHCLCLSVTFVPFCLLRDGAEGFTNSYSWQLAGVYFLQRCLLQQQQQQQQRHLYCMQELQGAWEQLLDVHWALGDPSWLPLLPNLQIRLAEHQQQQQQQQQQCAACGRLIPYPMRMLPEDDAADVFFYDPERGLNRSLSSSYVSPHSSSSSSSSSRMCSCGPWRLCGESQWPEDLAGLSPEAYARHLLLPSAAPAAAAATAAAFSCSGYKHRLGQPPAAAAATLQQLRSATKERIFAVAQAVPKEGDPSHPAADPAPALQRHFTDLLSAVVLLPPGGPTLQQLLRAFFRYVFTMRFD